MNLVLLGIVAYWIFEIWLIVTVLTSQPDGWMAALVCFMFVPYSVVGFASECRRSDCY